MTTKPTHVASKKAPMDTQSIPVTSIRLRARSMQVSLAGVSHTHWC